MGWTRLYLKCCRFGIIERFGQCIVICLLPDCDLHLKRKKCLPFFLSIVFWLWNAIYNGGTCASETKYSLKITQIELITYFKEEQLGKYFTRHWSMESSLWRWSSLIANKLHLVYKECASLKGFRAVSLLIQSHHTFSG